MPITKSAQKAIRSSKRKEAINKPVSSRMKSAVQTARNNPNPENISKAFSALDKAVKQNIIHKNKASRLKTRLTQLLPKTKTNS